MIGRTPPLTSLRAAAFLAMLIGTLPGLPDVRPASAADTIDGVPRVVDGDTLEINGVRIRMHGIDAPESDQTCQDRDGREWRCGDRATRALRDRIASSTVRCTARDTDRYGRTIAVCRDPGGHDLNAWMVANGWAVAYRRYARDYEAQEQHARDAGLGIWDGVFTLPSRYRRTGAQSPSQPTAAASCVIKGNIGRSDERIYHLPGGRWYDQTVIRTEDGERWFCNEQEARDAGWRRSHN